MSFNPNSLFLERVGKTTLEYKYITFPMEKCFLGRADTNEITFKSPNAKTISRKHCCFEFCNGKLYVQNLSESTRTFVNEDFIVQRTEVEVGDVIGIGCRPNAQKNVPFTEDERFIYKCRVPDKIVISDSDSENEPADDIVEITDDEEQQQIEVPVIPILEKEKIVENIKENPGILILNRLNIDVEKKSTSSVEETVNDLTFGDITQAVDDIENIIETPPIRRLSVNVKRLSQSELKTLEADSTERTKGNQAVSLPKSSVSRDDGEFQMTIAERNKIRRNSLKFSRTEHDKKVKGKQLVQRIQSIADEDSSESESEGKQIVTRRKLSKNSDNITQKTENSRAQSNISKRSLSSARNSVERESKKRKTSESSDASWEKPLNIPSKPIPFPKLNPTSKCIDSVTTLKNDSTENRKKIFNRSRSFCMSEYRRTATIIEALPMKSRRKSRDSNTKSTTSRVPNTEKSKVQEIDIFAKAKIMSQERPLVLARACNASLKQRRMSYAGESLQKANESIKEIDNKKAEPVPAKMVVPIRNTDNDNHNQQNKPKSSALKVKVTERNRGFSLTQEVPKKPVARAKLEEKQTALKENIHVQKFREKFVRASSSSTSSPTTISPHNLESYEQLNQKIAEDMVRSPTILPGTSTVIAPIGFYTPTAKSDKRVSFKDDNVLIESSDQQQQAVVQPMQQIKSIKESEIAVCDEILKWNTKSLQKGCDSTWHIKTMKKSYESIEEYKRTLKAIMDTELLTKLNKWYRKAFDPRSNSEPWDFMTVKNRTEINGRIRLELKSANELSNQKNYMQGTLLILRLKGPQSKEIDFFGYIRAINDRLIFQVDTLNKDVQATVAVLKCCSIMYIRSDIKALTALKLLQETKLVRKVLRPELNCVSARKPYNFYYNKQDLDEDQMKISKMFIDELIVDKTPNVYVLHGSAGTGKTYTIIKTIVNIIERTYNCKPSFLICALSNSCIDDIAAFTYEITRGTDIKLLRYGQREKITGVAGKFSLNDLVQAELQKRSRNYEDIQKEIIESSNIIFTTISASYELFDYKKRFSACVIEEANVVTDVELVIPLQLTFEKLLLVGDRDQLSIVPQSHMLIDTKFEETLFHRMIDAFKHKITNKPIFSLSKQHRMHEKLATVCSSIVYKTPANVSPSKNQHCSYKPFAILGSESNYNARDDSKPNSETVLACAVVEILCKDQTENLSIAMITPTSQQREEVKNNIKHEMDKFKDKISVFHAESAQGIEKDVVILILGQKDIQYILSLNRINVALTRAKKALYICANLNLINSTADNYSTWNELLKEARSRHLYFDMSKWDVSKLSNTLKDTP